MKRKTPLKRGAPLRTTVGLKRGKGLKTRSEAAAYWSEWQSHERLVVHVRASKHGMLCEAFGCVEKGNQVHHNFGRGDEPWSSWNALCSFLCQAHHESVTGRIGDGLDKGLRQQLRADAARRALTVFVSTALVATAPTDEEVVRWWTRFKINAKSYGWVPPDYEQFQKAGHHRGN